MSNRSEYKKFTAEITNDTLLDDFVPKMIDDLGQRYQPIKQIKDKYVDLLQSYSSKLQRADTGDITSFLSESESNITEIFSDIELRMKYFTLVFFGGVASGKTSMICDLANINPNELTTIFSDSPNFVKGHDDISIGPNVSTINLYEILIEKSYIRLVDVPGTGGVVHDNDTLAPFVNMADCVIFLIQASNDIMKDDENFIHKHVAAFVRRDTSAAEFKSEERTDKRILVVLNKWKKEFKDLPPIKADKIFETKCSWILHGEGTKASDGFSGIAGYFHKLPMVVRAETSYRDDDGEPLPAWTGENGQTDLHEVVGAIREILEDDGVDFRLNRPRQVLQKECNNLLGALTDYKANAALESLAKELDELGIKSQLTANQLEAQISERLARFEQTILYFLSSHIKPAMYSWEPKVGFLKGLKGVFNKKGLQESLKKDWSEELKMLIEARVDPRDFSQLVQKETSAFKGLIETNYQVLFLNKQDLLKKIPTLSTGGKESADVFAAMEKELDAAIKKIQMGLLDDLIGVIKWDAILAVLIGAILTPLGSFLLIAYRRWKRGESKGQEAKRELDLAVDRIAAEVSRDVRQKVMTKFVNAITDVHMAIEGILKKEKEIIDEPMRIVSEAIVDFGAFQAELHDASV
jgi:signal recognition particle receptor subunit beta